MQKERLNMGRINRTQKYAAMWLHSQGWAVMKLRTN